MASALPALGGMALFDAVDWGSLLTPTMPLLETFVRGTVVYLALFVLLRVVHRRLAGTVGITDLLMVVLIADAAQNAMAGEYRSITDGVLLVGTIVFWNWFLDWLGFRVPLVQRLVHPPPLRLVKDGRTIAKNLREELLTDEELKGQVRLHGVDDLSQVKEAYMESDGRVSVVKKGGGEAQDSESRRVS